MTLCGKDVLLVGQSFHWSDALTDRLQRWGFRCHLASDVRAASDLLDPTRLIWFSAIHTCLMAPALACWQDWPACQLRRSFACPSKIAASGCPPWTWRGMLGTARTSAFRICKRTRRNGAAFNSCAQDQLARPIKRVRIMFGRNGPTRPIAESLRARKRDSIQSKGREKAVTEHSSAVASIKISTDLNLVSVHELFDHTQDVFNLIARRAFEIFESRGDVHGNDQQDWFLAESELLTPVRFHISESGEQLTARAEIPEFNDEDIKVSLEPRRLSISGMAEPHTVHQFGKHDHLLRYPRLMFRVINLPCEVDPSKGQAIFNDGRLEIVMPKARPAKNISEETRPGLSSEGSSSALEMGGIEVASRAPVPTLSIEPTRKSQAVSSGR